MTVLPRTKFAGLDGRCIAAALGLLIFTGLVNAQQFDSEQPIFAAGQQIERPISMAVSADGEQIAVADPYLDRIAVVDFTGRPLWDAGRLVPLGRPLAVAFEVNNQLIFTRETDNLICRISRDEPTELDTVVDLRPQLSEKRRITQLLPTTTGNWLLLDTDQGELLHFTSEWELESILVPHGSGKGKVLVPTSLNILEDGRLLITDRKNYAAQMLAPDGDFMFYFGWGSPDQQRGWEALAAAVDSREIVWIADETEAAFRLFDLSGNQIGSVDFPEPLFRPIAMTGTIDNHMLVLDDNGRAVFYTLR